MCCLLSLFREKPMWENDEMGRGSSGRLGLFAGCSRGCRKSFGFFWMAPLELESLPPRGEPRMTNLLPELHPVLAA